MPTNKEIMVSIMLGVVSSALFELLKLFIQPIRAFGFAWTVVVFLLASFLFVIVALWLRLHKYSVLIEKIVILSKNYYDIFADVIFSQQGRSRKQINIEKIIWKFDFRINASNSRFLDLQASWEILLTSLVGKLNKIKIGLSGGNKLEADRMNMKVYQDNQPVTYSIEPLQCDVNILKATFNSSIRKNANSKLSFQYDWPEFSIINRNDDYVYFLPCSYANKVKTFTLKTTHPYESNARIFLLKHNAKIGYEQIEINDSNCTTYKISHDFTKNRAKEHLIEILDIAPQNVLIVIFER